MPAAAPRSGSVRAGDNALPMHIHQQAEAWAPGMIASGPAAPVRLRLGGLPLAPGAVATLFPDFQIEPGSAAAPELPFASLSEGLLRPPPHARAAAGCLSAVALA